MGIFDPQIELAKRQIAAKGELCQWIGAVAPVVLDASKPWVKEPGVAEQHDVRILFTSSGSNSLFKLIAGNVTASKRTALMAPVSFVPTPNDTVVRSDGTKLEIESVDSLAPNGQIILWWITFKQ
jgi:hypothetical protein